MISCCLNTASNFLDHPNVTSLDCIWTAQLSSAQIIITGICGYLPRIKSTCQTSSFNHAFEHILGVCHIKEAQTCSITRKQHFTLTFTNLELFKLPSSENALEEPLFLDSQDFTPSTRSSRSESASESPSLSDNNIQLIHSIPQEHKVWAICIYRVSFS